MRSALSRILWSAATALIAAIAPDRAEAAGPFGQQPGFRVYGNPVYSYGQGYYYSPGHAGYGYRQAPAYPAVNPYAGNPSRGGDVRASTAPRRRTLPGSGRVDPGAHISRPWLKNLPRGWGSP